MHSAFKPHRYFKNKHLQTCLPTIISKFKKSIDFEKYQIELDDGDSIELCFRGDKDKPLILMLPGLEGDIKSPYIQTIVPALNDAGWQVVVKHYRSCGASKSNRIKSYNSNNITDVELVLTYLQQHKQLTPSIAIGFSMGGNILLHHAYRAKHVPYDNLITVSTPFDMYEAAHYIPSFYEKRFLRSFKNKLRHKLHSEPSLKLTNDDLKQISSLYEFDDLITGPLWGFAGAKEYYNFSSVNTFLDKINIPTHMIYAKDDPFIPVHTMPSSAPSEHITLQMTDSGGHVGFLTDKKHHGHRYWLAHQIVNLVNSYVINK